MWVREATITDYDAYVALFAELEIDDPVPTAEHFETDLLPHTIVCELAGEVAGYATFRPLLRTAGHLYNLAVASTARGKRVGSTLMRAVAERFRARGITEWHLNVKADNRDAIRLYEHLGLTSRYASRQLQLAWSAVSALPDDPEPTRAAEIVAEDLPEIEAAFPLVASRLASSLQRANRVLRVLRDPHDHPVGIAAFSPAHPGAFPFAVARPTLVRRLCEELAPHALPDDAFANYVIEDDLATVDAMIAVGAIVKLELLHYAGPL
ncbi:MAG: GNAT family N-acetyltransferase [Kofleriaceae bacterium]